MTDRGGGFFSSLNGAKEPALVNNVNADVNYQHFK